MKHAFNHENLDCYKLSLEVARWVYRARFPRDCQGLRDQLMRASQSVVLNIAEGCGRGGRAEKNHFRIALGSAGECCAALDLVPLAGSEQQQDNLRRIGAMLRRLSG